MNLIVQIQSMTLNYIKLRIYCIMKVFHIPFVFRYPRLL